MVLGSIVNLLPGTLVAGSHGDRIYVHSLNLDGDTEGQIRAEERRIGRILGERPGG